jgi:hypothetical protein
MPARRLHRVDEAAKRDQRLAWMTLVSRNFFD